MTKQELVALLDCALESAKCGDDEMLDRCLMELCKDGEEQIANETEARLWSEAKKVPGGYEYAGVCSCQLCFWLRDGGELRLISSDADDSDGRMHIDHYDGKLPPGITGPAWKTGETL